MNDPILIRRAVRRALALRPRDGLTEEVIIEAVKTQGYQTLKVPELREAIEWNHARDLIEFEHNDDLDADLWKLTKKGKIKEGIA
jgi:hypothetical protein